MRGAREVCLAALVVMLMVSWYAVNLDPELSLAANARVRRSVSAAQRRAWAAGRAASDPSAAAVMAEPPSASALSAASAGGAPGPDGCPPGRRPYHVLMTAASGRYQEWQSRIAYYHYLKQKRLHPCSEMGGFTRLVNLPGGQPDRLVHEMPSVVVKQLSSNARKEGGDYGFIVMNRPWGARARGTGGGCAQGERARARPARARSAHFRPYRAGLLPPPRSRPAPLLAPSLRLPAPPLAQACCSCSPPRRGATSRRSTC